MTPCSYLQILASVILFVQATKGNDECILNLDNNMPNHLPIMLYSDGDYVLPSLRGSSREIRFKKEEKITLLCPGKGNYLDTGEKSTQTVNVTCEKDTSFRIVSDNNAVLFSRLSCRFQPKDVALKLPGVCGNSKAYTLAMIGYQTREKYRKSLIAACHDEKEASTLFTAHHVFGESLSAKDTKNVRVSFKEGGFYNTISAASAYRMNTQKQTFSDLVGSGYFVPSRQLYLVKGHLSPVADFIFEQWQDATFYYLNTVPQWASINNGNWKVIETAIRVKAKRDKATLAIYTGSYGVLSLEDKNTKEQVKIYLSEDSQGDKLPVPAQMWKVVHNVDRRTAVAFITINNPYHKGPVTSAHRLCQDVCNQIEWIRTLSWDRTNIIKGYTYCCRVADLQRAIPYGPALGTVKLME